MDKVLEENFEEFSGRLKYLMDKHDMSYIVLASNLGVNATNIYRYLNGTRKPSVDKVLELANYFEVDAAWLIGQKEQYPRPE